MAGGNPPDPSPPRGSDVMARLTLSAVERLVAEPGGWGEPAVHRALLVSGLSVLLTGLAVMEGHRPR
ncbi:MAG: hypothetical protein RLZZ219_1387 [Cyanobacteriota bacterium]|jgi:hypothetical protein